MIRENYRKASVIQRMIAVAGCVIGGALVVILAILAAFGGYDSLARAGYSVLTIPFYGLVILCGFGILFRIPYALIGAIALCLIEIIAFLTTYLSTTVDVNFLFLVKIAVILCCTQLMVVTVSTSDDEEEEPAPRRAAMQGGPQPRNRQHMAQGAMPRNGARGMAPPAGVSRPRVGRGMPPQPRR